MAGQFTQGNAVLQDLTYLVPPLARHGLDSLPTILIS